MRNHKPLCPGSRKDGRVKGLVRRFKDEGIEKLFVAFKKENRKNMKPDKDITNEFYLRTFNISYDSY